MPLYEYECRECGHRFEALVQGKKRPACPECGSEDLEKLLSTFGVGSGGGAGGWSGTSRSGNCFSGG